MEIYLLKSAACMGIFLLFYKLLLENESMHQFKRFFLLTAVIASFIIPQIVFTKYIEVEPTTAVTQIISINEPQNIQPVVQAIERSPMNWSLILWTIYGLGVAGFAFRFMFNLLKIWKRIRNNPKKKHSTIYRILLKEQLPPHTFLKYIFLNKQKFETKSIPNSVLLHEETHAIQRHSLDVLFLEVLQVVFWFNPLIYVYKKTIKLNHEFLADSAVLNGQEDHLNYQNTLLSYLSNDSFNTHQSVGIANAINYSSIKKRFIIMKKQTSKKGIAIRSLLLLPVLALMLYGFSQKNVIAENTIKDINIEITKTGDLLMNNEPVALEKLSTEVLRTNQNFGPYIIKNYLTAHILYDENQYRLIEQVQTELKAIGISNIEHFSKKTTNILDENAFTPSKYHGQTVDEAQRIRRNNVFNEHKTDANHEPLLEIAWIEVKNENEIWFNDQLVPLSKLNEKVKAEFPLAIKNNKLSAQIYAAEIINSGFTDAITKELRKLKTKSITIFSDKYIMPKNEYEETVEITPETVILKTNDIILQEIATKEQISTYNALAKKYNTMIAEGVSIRIMKSDVDQLNYIYGLMSAKQKKVAEPFPDFPEPPPAPKAPNSSDYAYSQINEIIENQDPYDHLNLDTKAINGIPSNIQTFHSKPSSPVAPPPPTPPSPLDYAISMAKKGATFFYEDKAISSNKAIDLLKKNKELNIESREKNGKAEVRITKEPVTIH
tara:strand:- start:35302 stop:37458 length:2157 start_codon:yes stop_codon:yes gene_type:complete